MVLPCFVSSRLVEPSKVWVPLGGRGKSKRPVGPVANREGADTTPRALMAVPSSWAPLRPNPLAVTTWRRAVESTLMSDQSRSSSVNPLRPPLHGRINHDPSSCPGAGGPPLVTSLSLHVAVDQSRSTPRAQGGSSRRACLAGLLVGTGGSRREERRGESLDRPPEPNRGESETTAGGGRGERKESQPPPPPSLRS